MFLEFVKRYKVELTIMLTLLIISEILRIIF
jgi:hypothetical protein